MRFRIALARLLIRLGRFIQTASLVVMRPDDLVEYSRQSYVRLENVNAWSEAEFVDSGLTSIEENLLKRLPLNKGRLLLLGVGGGREAISLAKLGFQVTGVDYVPEMVKQSKLNAIRHGMEIEGINSEISQLKLADNSYEVIWLSVSMYSCVPTRKRRILLLKNFYHALQREGYFICQFQWNNNKKNTLWAEKAKKILAWLTLGYTSYEPGDMLLHNIEFVHGFRSIEELSSEFSEGGFEIVHIDTPNQHIRGGAVLRKYDLKG